MSLPESSRDSSTQSSPEDSPRKQPVSVRRVQANRRNALLSTGPKTTRGKGTVARNAIKHGLLIREAVITAGDDEENLEEFYDLVERLCEYYEPVGVVEETLIQRVATCWWRLARVIRAENGEIRKRLDTIEVDRVLRNSDQVNLFLAVSNMELGFFSRENPADKTPLIENGLRCNVSRPLCGDIVPAWHTCVHFWKKRRPRWPTMVTSQNELVVPFVANSAFGTICSYFSVCTPVRRQPQPKMDPLESWVTKKLRRNAQLLSP